MKKKRFTLESYVSHVNQIRCMDISFSLAFDTNCRTKDTHFDNNECTVLTQRIYADVYPKFPTKQEKITNFPLLLATLRQQMCAEEQPLLL